MIENLCKKCIHIDQKPCFNPCLDCDHRVNKVKYGNNFQPKKTAFQEWNEKEFWSYNEATEDIHDLVGRERKKTWNAAIDAVLKHGVKCSTEGGFNSKVGYFMPKEIENLKEP